ncbi:two-partner secretion domain-containing protein [Herbaspirillum camelliae]|uniref:two-partner secretion domain-containing protein n=1 Tax=Herbaspirillum camelliae TaxID=1892903 RepID=UPI000949D4AA|nr:filamentous hemagglutinin N-terminal domain-containing protein [Herbaspirillum camelliae]
MRRATPSTFDFINNSARTKVAVDKLSTLTIATGPKSRPLWQRMMSCVLAFVLWFGPLQFIWTDAKGAAAQIGVGADLYAAREGYISWGIFASEVKDELAKAKLDGNWIPVLTLIETRLPGYLKVALGPIRDRLPDVSFGSAALAAPIADPSAPIRFQPTVTTSSGPGGGVPVINITAPNAAGISLNQYSQFNVDAIGLILNNSLIGGGTTLGGTVAANSGLDGRTASQIINQVTTQGSPSRIAGTIEVFGAQADVIIANPNGITCTACGFINTPRVVMTTGEPQFLATRGGAASGFDTAAALSYNVTGGHIQIEGLAGANGVPGAGIEGSAGVIDLIGGSVGINASVNAGRQINVISGQQLVSEAVAGQGKAGSDYNVTSNGSALNFSGPIPGVQIDATAFGAMNAGQIKIVATAEGLGVKAAVLNANSGNVSIDANGDLSVGDVYGNQATSFRATGKVAANSITSYGNAGVAAGSDVTIGKMTVANDIDISGKNIAIANAMVGGNLVAAGVENVSTDQSGAVAGNAKFSAGTLFANSGKWTAGATVEISAPTVVNATSAQMVGLNATKVVAGDLGNYGTLYGGAVDLTLSGRLDNSFGSLLSKSALVARANSLYSNLGGTIYVGDPNAAANSVPAGDMSLTISGSGNSLNNLGGMIAAGNGLSIDATNSTMDLSGALSGRLNSAGPLSIRAGTLNNSGAWLAGGSSVSLSGTNGISNQGVIQTSGDLSLSSGATIANAGVVVAGRDLTVNGSTNNLSGATVHAERNAVLTGGGRNAGTIESLNDVALQGANFDNSGGTIQANRNFSASSIGTLTNVAGTIAAQGDVAIQASIVNNDRAAPITIASTSEEAINVALVRTAKIGKQKVEVPYNYNPNVPYVITYTVADAYLSDLLAKANSIDTGAGTFTVIGEQGKVLTYALPKVDRINFQQKEGAAGKILAGNNALINAGSLSNRGGVVTAAKELTANLDDLQNGSSDTVITSRTGDTVNLASLTEFARTNQPYFSLLVGYVAADSYSPPSSVVETRVLGTRGVLAAGTNVSLNGRGNLINAGDLVAGNNINIALPGNFINQGTYQSSFTTRPGCLPSITCRENNAHVDTFAYQQTSNNVVAGGSLTVTARTIANDFGTLSARGNVNLSAGSVDNLAGSILSSGGDVNIAAASIINRVVSPVVTHVSYGNVNPEFAAGCNGGGTYKGSECNVDKQNQASAAAVISGARNVNIDGDHLVNTGSLITAGADAKINISNSVVNAAVSLNTYWQGHWTEETCWFCSDKEHYTNGVIADGIQVAGIQAGSVLTLVSNGNVLNTGNLYGTDVSLSGSTLVNGITDSRQPTATSTVAPQLIAIGPTGGVTDSGGAPDPRAPVYAVAGGDLLASFGPSLLVSNLPSNLRPGTNLFYYDASTESNLIRQAAITQTGSGTFVKGVAWNSTSSLSIDDQQKAILYNNSIQYATEHDLQLGKPLTADQVAALDKPMLWYTEQNVPDPSCSFGSTKCGNITALMPQVYLPPNYVGRTAGGVISGSDVKLSFSQSITNTGIIQATNLAVKTASLTNEQRSVDIGVSDYKVQGGWVEYSGTQLQPGGFMSAVNLNVQADRITAIGDAFRVVNADGTHDVTGTNALLNSLRQQLGGDFTEIAAHDNIHTDFIKDTSGPGAFGQVIAIAIAVALSVMTGGTAGLAVMQTITGSAVAAGSAAAIVAAGINAAIVGTLSSIATQVITTGRVDLGAALKSGAVSGVVAGLTAGVLGNAPGTPSGSGLTEGASNSASSVTPSSGAATQLSKGSWEDFVSHPGTYTANTAIRSGISAAINSAVYGGSFGTAFLNGVVADAAAIGANGIGGVTDAYSLQNLLGHALLGCAAAALGGADCAGGAVGGIAGALVAPFVRDGVYGTDALHYNDAANNATVAALSALAGGGLAIALGASASAAANGAVNEALNNSLSDPVKKALISSRNCDSLQCLTTSGEKITQMYQTAQADMQTACTGGESTSCQQARDDFMSLRNELQRISTVLSASSTCETAGCVAVSTGATVAIGAMVGAALSKITTLLRGVSLSKPTPSSEAAQAPKEIRGSSGPAPDLANRATEIRAELNIGGGRNVAVAQYSIDGATGELVGVSGQAARPGTVDAPAQQIFETIQTGNNSRTLDSEYKILSYLATKLNSASQGVVNLYSELPVCVSCSGVIDQFRQKFPNIVLNVTTGKP